MTIEPTTSDQITRELLTVLPLLNRLVAYVLRQEGKDETTVVQMRIITHLLDNPMTLTALAKKRHISLQSASEQVQSLVERGWILRVTNPKDRRQSLLHVTDEGRQQYLETRTHVIATLNPLIARLSPEENETVHQALLILQEILSQYEKGWD
jgi:DNA-binding MarR family transcriptional regulator